MSDSLKLYSTLLSVFEKLRAVRDLRHAKVLAWLVCGVLLEKTITLPALALVMVSEAKAAGRTRRLRRFLANKQVKVRDYYDSLIRAALHAWQGQTLYVVLDTTSLNDRLVIARLALVYRGRAVPLVWQVYDQKSVMLAFSAYEALLEHARTLLPTPSQIVLLGDRGFRTTELMAWCQKSGWHFRLRLMAKQLIQVPGERAQTLADLRVKPGMVRFLQGIQLGGESYGPLNLAIALAKTPNAQVWYIATDQPATDQTLTEYGFRMDIEEAFLDDKSNGFQLEECLLPDAPSVERLLLVLAIATLYLLSMGTWVVQQEQRGQVDAHWGRGLSYFQIGWRWIRHRLAQGHACPFLLWLVPGPDPDPVVLPCAKRVKPRWVHWPALPVPDSCPS